MSFKHVDMDAAIRRVADRRIEEAMKEGKFDNLRGKGQPLDLEPLPADEKARMMWWALRIMKTNDVIPDEVQWRKAVDLMKAKLHTLKDESGLEPLVRQINDLVHRINTLGTNAISIAISPVDLEHERARLRHRPGAGTP